MEKDTENLPEFDSNRALDYSHVSQEIEDEIKRVKQALAYLESKSAQVSNEDQIAYRRMRSSLRKYLNLLYQARRFVTGYAPLVVIEQYLSKLISLQDVFNKYAAVFKSTPLAVKLYTQGTNVLVFLVTCVFSTLMAQGQKQDKESTGVFDSNCCLKGKAKSLYHNSDLSPPLSTLTIYPVFQPPKWGPPKGDDDQEKDMKSTDVDINNEAEVPCDDASGNTGYSKNVISSGDKDIANDEVASSLESSTSTLAEHLQCNQNVGEVVDEVPPTTAVEDTGSHTLVDDFPSPEQTLPPSTPLSALELETKKMVYSFNDTGELPDTIQEQSSQPDNVPPSGFVVNANGQSDTNKEISTHQTANVSSEEKFVLSPGSH